MPLAKFIPQQKRMSTILGGMLILVSETKFLFSMLNFVLVTRIQYYNPGDAYMRQLFPNYLLFLGVLAPRGTTGHDIGVYIHPAQ
ncbi:MAG: hypothetical protein C5S43_00665 [Candidatus Methanocomedens sp.]|nr:MAG: hypothetical protein C5S43_00665 [ANME-2 cluster archaeon]